MSFVEEIHTVRPKSTLTVIDSLAQSLGLDRKLDQFAQRLIYT